MKKAAKQRIVKHLEKGIARKDLEIELAGLVLGGVKKVKKAKKSKRKKKFLTSIQTHLGNQ